ncbi:unnamed protein product [Moneuplotes crassus]|uniref:Cyclic nucleotide-binding domain-containing protein n=1 Tax=Euplotes crassus TaxID=5936 RepID=A0AAD1TZD4_EUPCR|nr:unnamed protein product [Moneuplotes crassus]
MNNPQQKLYVEELNEKSSSHKSRIKTVRNKVGYSAKYFHHSQSPIDLKRHKSKLLMNEKLKKAVMRSRRRRQLIYGSMASNDTSTSKAPNNKSLNIYLQSKLKAEDYLSNIQRLSSNPRNPLNLITPKERRGLINIGSEESFENMHNSPKKEAKMPITITKSTTRDTKNSTIIGMKKLLDDSKVLIHELEEHKERHQNYTRTEPNLESEIRQSMLKLKENNRNLQNLFKTSNKKKLYKKSLNMDLFPQELVQNGEYDHFVRKVYPEILRRENINPYQVSQLKLNQRTKKHLSRLKRWLQQVDFMRHYPDLILQKVCDCIQPVAYKKGEVIIKKGDISTFMTIIYKGEIGIYISLDLAQLQENPTNYITEYPPVAIKGKRDVIGEQGLLRGEKRGANCVAFTDIQAFNISFQNYKDIIKGFHRVKLQKNIQYLSEISYFRYLSYEKIEKLAKSFNTIHLKTGEAVVREGKEISQMFILKEGNLDVQKVIKIEDSNSWPTQSNKRQCVTKSKYFKNSVFQIHPLEFFGLNESLSDIPIKSTLTSHSDGTTVLCIQISDIQKILDKEELLALQSSDLNVKIPDQSKLVRNFITNYRAERKYSKAIKNITETTTLQYSRRHMLQQTPSPLPPKKRRNLAKFCKGDSK